MFSRITSHGAVRRVAFVIALATTAVMAACAGDPAGPARNDATDTIGSLTPRFDDGDTTNTRGCAHTQGWDC